MSSIHIRPKLYETFAGNGKKFICLGGRGGWKGQKLWQRVVKKGWFWVNKGEKFWDWPNMFFLVEGKENKKYDYTLY